MEFETKAHSDEARLVVRRLERNWAYSRSKLIVAAAYGSVVLATVLIAALDGWSMLVVLATALCLSPFALLGHIALGGRLQYNLTTTQRRLRIEGMIDDIPNDLLNLWGDILKQGKLSRGTLIQELYARNINLIILMADYTAANLPGVTPAQKALMMEVVERYLQAAADGSPHPILARQARIQQAVNRERVQNRLLGLGYTPKEIEVGPTKEV